MKVTKSPIKIKNIFKVHCFFFFLYFHINYFILVTNYKMIINVKATLFSNKNLRFELCVNPFCETVQQVKEKIQRRLGIPSENQRVLYKSVVLDNSRLILDCGIRNGSTISAEEEFQSPASFELTVIKPNGCTMRLVVKDTNTVNQMKEMINAIEGIPAYQQKLIFEGYILEDEKTLDQYGLDTNSKVTLTKV